MFFRHGSQTEEVAESRSGAVGAMPGARLFFGASVTQRCRAVRDHLESPQAHRNREEALQSQITEAALGFRA